MAQGHTGDVSISNQAYLKFVSDLQSCVVGQGVLRNVQLLVAKSNSRSSLIQLPTRRFIVSLYPKEGQRLLGGPQRCGHFTFGSLRWPETAYQETTITGRDTRPSSCALKATFTP